MQQSKHITLSFYIFCSSPRHTMIVVACGQIPQKAQGDVVTIVKLQMSILYVLSVCGCVYESRRGFSYVYVTHNVIYVTLVICFRCYLGHRYNPDSSQDRLDSVALVT